MNIKTIRFISLVFASMVMVSGFAEAPVVEASQEFQTDLAANDDMSKGPANPVVDHHQAVASDDNQQPAATPTPSKTPSHATEDVDSAKQPAATQPSTANMTVEQRLARLEQQVNNLANMNFAQQIALQQQQIAQLRGQQEVQGHDLQLLNKQVRSFYQDLYNRISQMSNLNSGSSSGQAAKSDSNRAPAETNVQLQDANTYQAAFTLLTNRKYDKAQQAFSTYMNDYPNGKYVADAHYWLGEIYMIRKNYKNAESEFQNVLSKYPQSNKVSDAKLKIAIIHANTGKVEQAKTELRAIKQKHPDSTAAQLANIRLQQLEQGENLGQ